MKSKIFSRSISTILVLAIFSCLFLCLTQEFEVNAETYEIKPTFTIKRINKGTGIKIIIDKTDRGNKKYDGYNIYIRNISNSYSKYKEIAKLEFNKKGNKKRTIIINGLPKGTYGIMISAILSEDNDWAGAEWDSDEKIIKIKAAPKNDVEEKEYDFKNVNVGDIITFGSYEQDDDMLNGKEEIEWIVLSKSKSNILVVSKYALDCLPYNLTYDEVTWENCTLRKWLNKVFYKNAFTEKERNMIKKVTLTNNDNSIFKTDGGKNTKDKVFILSTKEIEDYRKIFESSKLANAGECKCYPTAYALAQGIWVKTKNNDGSATKIGVCKWWTRTPGDSVKNSVYAVYCEDELVKDYQFLYLYEYGFPVSTQNFGVRPALYINIQS